MCQCNGHTPNISGYISNYYFSRNNIYNISLMKHTWNNLPEYLTSQIWFILLTGIDSEQSRQCCIFQNLDSINSQPHQLSWQTRSHTVHLHSQLACLLWSFPSRHETVIWFILLYYCFLCLSPCFCLGTHDESTARGQHTEKVRLWRRDKVKMWLQFQTTPKRKSLSPQFTHHNSED